MQIIPTPTTGISALAQAYLKHDTALDSFFNGNFGSIEAFKKVMQNNKKQHREKLVEVLEKQNISFGNNGEKALQNIRALKNEDSFVVITGQQVSLFTGASYTLYKTLTTIQLAKQLSQELGKTVVPVFWLETEDHDLAEANHVHIFKGNEVVELAYTGHQVPENGNLGSVGKIRFTEQIEEVVQTLDDILPPTEFKATLMQAVRESYTTGKNFTEAFASLMLHLIPNEGIVFACSYNKSLKELLNPLFQKELADYQSNETHIQKAGKSLVEAGFHAQINSRPTHLFYIDKAGRYAIEPHKEGFKLRGQETYFNDAKDLIYPRLSPNVALRPITQDLLFPTIAYVAGPGEIAYFAQLKALYKWAGIEMPIIYPRVSATIIENRIAKIMEKEDLSLLDAKTEIETLFKQKVLAKSDKDLQAVFQKLNDQLENLGNEVKHIATTTDISLEKSAEALKVTWQNEAAKFEKKLIAAEKRNNEQLRTQLERVQMALFPNGVAQERVISPLYFINKFGFSFVKELLETLPLSTEEHQTILT